MCACGLARHPHESESRVSAVCACELRANGERPPGRVKRSRVVDAGTSVTLLIHATARRGRRSAGDRETVGVHAARPRTPPALHRTCKNSSPNAGGLSEKPPSMRGTARGVASRLTRTRAGRGECTRCPATSSSGDTEPDSKAKGAGASGGGCQTAALVLDRSA